MVRFALIGAGLMGALHVKSSLGNPLIQFTAVCDLNQEAAHQLALLAGAAVYTDVDEMLSKEEIDAVVIATPDHLHAEPFIKAAEAKKAVMVEKPFATTTADGKRMLEAAARNGVPVQMAHLFRFLPFYMNLKNAAMAGEFGEILSTNVVMLNRLFVPTKMLKWAAASSPSWFLLSHSIDAILWVNDCRVKKLSARGVKRKLVSMGIDTYDLVKVTAELENGALSSFEANWVIPDSYPITAAVQMVISGTEGTMTVSTGDPIITKATKQEFTIPGILEYDLYGYYSGLRRNMIETFARCVENNTAPPTTAVDGYNTLCVLEAIDRSMENGGAEIQLSY